MPNRIPFSVARDDANDLQIALILALHEIRVLANLADIVYAHGLDITAHAIKTAAATAETELKKALAAGENFHRHHQEMVAQVRALREEVQALQHELQHRPHD